MKIQLLFNRTILPNKFILTLVAPIKVTSYSQEITVQNAVSSFLFSVWLPYGGNVRETFLAHWNFDGYHTFVRSTMFNKGERQTETCYMWKSYDYSTH